MSYFNFNTVSGVLWILAIIALPAGMKASSPAWNIESRAETNRDSLAGLYEIVSPAVVGIDSWAKLAGSDDSYAAFGTGFLIDPAGLILTSITVVPENAQVIRVYLQGGRRIEAKRILSIPEKELVLLRPIKRGENPGRRFPFLRLGDSSSLYVGQLAFALGNAFRSIAQDNQVSFAAGAISGSYVLSENQNESRYLGPALETTSAVNDGMDGGPLVNAWGEVIGLLSLNFSRNRWLGTAIPIDILKPYLKGHLGWFGDRLERFPAYLGIELFPAEIADPQVTNRAGVPVQRAVVVRVDSRSPATRAGIQVGDHIVSWNGNPVGSVNEFREQFDQVRPGKRVKLEIERRGERRLIEVVLGGRF